MGRLKKSFGHYVKQVESCWLWIGGASDNGYGKYGQNYAHRVSYEISKGPIPTGLHIDHLCKVRRCVNPDHLEAVTKKENNLRSSSVMADNARKSSCKRGHAFTEENTYRTPSTGARVCRQCMTIPKAGGR